MKTPGGITIEHYEYMTGGDAREYQKLFTAKMSAVDLMNAGDKKTQADAMGKIDASIIFESQELLVKQLVVKVGEENVERESALKAVLALKPNDTTFVIEALDKLSNGEEKKSDGQSVSTSQGA